MIRTVPTPTELEIEPRAVITEHGISLPDGLGFDDWLGIGRKLMLADKAVQWAIGDWWVYGDHRYGERAAAAIDPATGENRLTRYMQYGWVARSIETSRRKEVLSWTAHEAVASLEPDIQDAILTRAIENGWGSREVRAAVKEYKERMAGGNKPRLSNQTPADDVAESETEADKPIFDGTGAGKAMAAERAERRQDGETLSDAHQTFLQSLDAVERAIADENRRMLPMARINTDRVYAVIKGLTSIAVEADAAHENAFKRQSSRRRNSSAPDASPSPHGGADKGGDDELSPSSSSTPSDQSSGIAPAEPPPSAGHGADESPALIQADAEVMS